MPGRRTDSTTASKRAAPTPRAPRRRSAPLAAKHAARDGWLLLIYRVPSEPSNNRVSVWRELKRLGALYLQQCVCIVPALPVCEEGIRSAVSRVENLGGSSNLFRLRELPPDEEARLMDEFRALSAKEYAEIVEECRTKFVKEIEFERFRENYTYEEAEEIREDLEKIRRWFTRIVERDWFSSGQREEVAAELAVCERLLEAFEEDVYRRAGEDQSVRSTSKVTPGSST
ncbi:MAG TPA: Chromate resistance protein ChrB [Chloroflexota bacterium]|nr:Chromate resistance protein ChrB [Chloroflexota bacterium]